MNFVSISEKKMGLTNQIFILANGIANAVKKKCNVAVVGEFLCDYNSNKYTDISNVLDIERTSAYVKQKYNLLLISKHDFKFDLLNVTYGTEYNKIDITQNIKDKYYHDKKLHINKNVIFNEIQGDPHPCVEKNVWFKYKINNNIIIDKYEENLSDDIDYTNDNYIPVWITGWPVEKRGVFLDVLTHIVYDKQFLDISKQQLSDINLTNKVNLIHLRIEDDAIRHWSMMNDLSHETFKAKLEDMYIKMIQDYIDKNDTTIILSSSFDNNVVSYLNENKYNTFFTDNKKFKDRELNAIVDLFISKHCNNVFIGAYNTNGDNGSTFSCYIYETLYAKDITYKYIDLDHL